MLASASRVKALIKVGYACNDNCTFCHTQEVRHIDDTAREVTRKIARARQLGHTMVVFSGGEATIRPEIVQWASEVRHLGMKLGFVTNGRRFSDPAFVRAMLERGLAYAYVSLHGGEARLHNSLVRSSAFDETLAGIRALHGKVPDLRVNCVVTKTNVSRLRGVVDLLLPLEHLTLKFSMIAPKGGGDRSFDHIVAPVEEVARAIEGAIRYGEAQRGERPGPLFGHDSIPLCLLPGLGHLYDDLRTNDFRTMSEVGEADFFPIDHALNVQPDEPCSRCAVRGQCPGLFRGYVDRFPESARLLRPQPGARANSYNLVPTRDVFRKPGEPCPILEDGTTSYDRGRSVFLRLRDRMRLYETTTLDFADTELLETKEARGQLYLDVSKKLAPDDFAVDLRKLTLSAECRSCPARASCTGSWTAVPGDVFTRDDARVHALLGAMRGDVLDVGAGEGRYLASLAASDVTYTAIEPDGVSASAIQGRLPGATVLLSPLEETPLPEAGYDHVLVLRSYNHLPDPRAAMARLVGALRSGGTLTVVDNVAFGLLRDQAHARSAEAGPARREHHRNDGAADAEAALAGLPLVLRERHDTTPETSNQWLLHYEKTR